MVTIVLRAPQAYPAAQVARFDGTRWAMLPTENGGLPDLYAANIGQFGDFAVVLTGAVASPSASGPSAGSQASLPPPSGGSDGATQPTGTPAWVVILFAVAAIGVGLAWGVLKDAGRR